MKGCEYDKGGKPMNKLNYLATPMNLHLFDGAGTAGNGGASPASSGEAGTSETTNAGITQSANGRGNENADLIKQDATASRQNIAVTSSDDERRANFEN